MWEEGGGWRQGVEVSGLSWKEMGVGMGDRGRCSFDIRWLVWCGGDGRGGRREGGREREERERERFFVFCFASCPDYTHTVAVYSSWSSNPNFRLVCFFIWRW